MRHQEFVPPEELQDSIKCFWHNVLSFDELQQNFEVMPDGYTEIIFHFGNGCSLVQSGSIQQLPSPFMMGLINHPLTFNAPGHLEIIGIRCYPWTVFDLLGLPSNKNNVHTFDHPIAQLQPQLNKLVDDGKIQEAITLVKTYLLDMRKRITTNSMLFKAGVAMRKASGSLPVSQVADAAHATVRTLERNFRQSSGHTVKDVSALVRFEQVRNRLWNYPDVNLAALAHELGYTDQSHLSKEFKRYSGTTPAAFARNAKKNQLAITADFVAFVQA